MTIDELIDSVVGRIHKEHYVGTSRMPCFHRDRVALEKSVARYGHECHQRGWEFEPETIYGEIMRILDSMTERTDAIRIWFPLYLEASVDRHVRLRAEELSAQAKKIASIVGRTVAWVQLADVREPTAVEILATVYANHERRRRQRKKMASAPKVKQLGLL